MHSHQATINTLKGQHYTISIRSRAKSGELGAYIRNARIVPVFGSLIYASAFPASFALPFLLALVSLLYICFHVIPSACTIPPTCMATYILPTYIKDCTRSRGPLAIVHFSSASWRPLLFGALSEMTEQARMLSVTYIGTHIVFVA
jgi:hypothetical protein